MADSPANEIIPAALINENVTAPIVYEDRIRISRAKFESLFGWKAATDLQQNPNSEYDEPSGDEAACILTRQTVDDIKPDVQSQIMPSCICEIMRENRVTVVPSFRRSQQMALENATGDSITVAPNSKNKRDYVLRIFGDNENDVAAAKFKIQSAVHQVAVMGSQSQSNNAKQSQSWSSIQQTHGAIGCNVTNPLGSSVSSTSVPDYRQNQQPWWSNVSDRITLRVDVDYTVHSHLIGRSGGNIASVMNATRTHIHFPDSNKQSGNNNRNNCGSRSVSPSLNQQAAGFSSNPPAKNNYVTVSGPGIDQIEEARAYIRRMTPLRLAIPFRSLQVPLSITGQVFIPARLAASSRRVMQEFCDRGLSAAMRNDSLVVSGTLSIADLVIQATQQICMEVYECLVPVSLNIDITPRDWAFVRGPGDCYTRKIEHVTGCQFLFPAQGLEDPRLNDGRRQPIRIVGFPANVVKARFLLQARLPIQLSWPFRSNASGYESDAALKEIVATKYEIFMSIRDRNSRSQGQNQGRDSGSATPDLTIGSKQNRPASSGAAAYQMVQPKHIVLKSFEGNLPNVYRFYAYMRELGNSSSSSSSKPSSRAASRLDDMTSPPTPPQSPAWWVPIPSEFNDEELYSKVDALVQDSFMLSARSNSAGSLPNFGGFNVISAADPAIYTAYAFALAQQQQQQQAVFAAALANGWTPPANQYGLLQQTMKAPVGVFGRGTTLYPAPTNQTNHISVAAASRAVLSQRNAEMVPQYSPRSADDGGASSPDSNSSGSLENYNVIIDEKVINGFRPPSVSAFQHRSVSSMSAMNRHDGVLPEGRPITAASRVIGQRMSFDSSNNKDAADRLLEQFAASLTRAGSALEHRDLSSAQSCGSGGAVIVSAESHKIYEVPRRPNHADPIASGIISIAEQSEPQQTKLPSPQQHLRIPTGNNCGLLFSLSQPDGQLNATVSNPGQSSQKNLNRHANNLPNFGASSIVVGDHMNKRNVEQPNFMLGSIGAEFLGSRASSGQGRSLSITGGFASKLQTTELYYEQFADRIDERLGAVLCRSGVARSDIGKLASQEVKLDAFMTMTDSDLRDCGIWQLGVRRQLLKIIAELHQQKPVQQPSIALDGEPIELHQSSPERSLSTNSGSNERLATHSDPLPMASSSIRGPGSPPSSLEISTQPQQLLPPHSQQLPPQSPPYFASLKTYKLESEFRLL